VAQGTKSCALFSTSVMFAVAAGSNDLSISRMWWRLIPRNLLLSVREMSLDPALTWVAAMASSRPDWIVPD
jgi:hypothetical protein